MRFSRFERVETQCLTCGALTAVTHCKVVVEGEEPLVWARALRGSLHEMVCPHGHRNAAMLPTMFLPDGFPDVVFAPSHPDRAQQEFMEMGAPDLGERVVEGPVRFRVVRWEDVPYVLRNWRHHEALLVEGGSAGEREPPPGPRDMAAHLAAFEHPTPRTAAAIALRCKAALSDNAAGLDEVSLRAQLARCLVLAENATPADVEEAIGLIRRVLPEFEKRGALRDQGAANRDLADAFLLRESADLGADAAQALAALDHAQELLTEEYSKADWAEILLRRARALAILGRTSEAEIALQRILTTVPEQAMPALVAEAVRLRGRLDVDDQVLEEARRIADPGAKFSFLVERQHRRGVLELVDEALATRVGWASRPTLLYLKGYAILEHPVVGEAEGLAAVGALEEALATADDEEIPFQQALELLATAYKNLGKDALGQPLNLSGAGRLGEWLLAVAAEVVGAGVPAAMPTLRRANALLRHDADRRGQAAAAREALRIFAGRVGDVHDAAIRLDRYDEYQAEMRERYEFDLNTLEEYVRAIDGIAHELGVHGEPKMAAELLSGSMGVRSESARRENTPERLGLDLRRLGQLLLQAGDHGNAFRSSSSLLRMTDYGLLGPSFRADALLGMATALSALGIHRDALDLFAQVRDVKLDGDDADEVHAMACEGGARASIAIGDAAAARAWLDRLGPSPDPHLELGTRQLELLRSGDAHGAALLEEERFRLPIRTYDDMEEMLAILTRRAELAFGTGSLDAAKGALHGAESVLAQMSRETHHAWADVHELAADVARSEGTLDQTYHSLRAAVEADWRTADDRLSLGSAQARARHLGRMRRRAEKLLDFVRVEFPRDLELIGLAYQAVARTKAFNTEIEQLNRREVERAARGDTKVADAVASLAEMRAELGRLALDRDAQRDGIEALVAQKAAKETELSAKVPSTAIEAHVEWATLRDLLSRLPRDTTLIDYVRLNDTAEGARYVALVTFRMGPGTILVDLGDAPQIDELVREARLEILEPPVLAPGETAQRAGLRLRKLLIDPLIPFMGGNTRLLICPDGALHSLPFDLLPVKDRWLIDGFVTSLVSSVRALDPRPPEEAVFPSEPLVVGGAEFSGCPTGRRGGAGRGFLFKHLEGTELEAKTVARRLGTTPRLGAAATKDSVATTASPSIIHLATHGYFLEAAQVSPQLARHSLLRCGLAFSGANRENASAGILTGEEVLGLDLRATELAVLSACQTGLGDPERGEGLAGLARCFEAAGAKSAVVGLWEVPDDATRELMDAFYRELLAGNARVDALRTAKLEIRTWNPAPRDWGGFVLQGATGSLKNLRSDARSL